MAAAARVTSTGTLVASGARLLGLWVVHGATGGTVELKDGGSGGTSRLVVDTAAAAGEGYVEVPGGGIPFGTDIHATLTNVSGVTAFYQ